MGGLHAGRSHSRSTLPHTTVIDWWQAQTIQRGRSPRHARPREDCLNKRTPTHSTQHTARRAFTAAGRMMRLALGFGMLTAVAGHGESWPSPSPQAPPCLTLCTCFHLSLPLSCLPLPCLSLYLYGPGAMVQPRTRNSVEWQVGVNTQRCSNLTGDACNNGQAAFWYSQGTSSRSLYLQVPVNALPPLLHWKCTARARVLTTRLRAPQAASSAARSATTKVGAARSTSAASARREPSLTRSTGQSIVTPSLSANSTSTSTIPGLPRAAPLSRTPAVSRADRHRARTAPKPAAVRPWPRGFAHRASRVAVPQRRSDVMWWSVMLRRHQDQVCTARRRRNAGAQGDPQLQASGVQGRRRC